MASYPLVFVVHDDDLASCVFLSCCVKAKFVDEETLLKIHTGNFPKLKLNWDKFILSAAKRTEKWTSKPLWFCFVLFRGEMKDTYSRTSLVKGFIVLDSKAMG